MTHTRLHRLRFVAWLALLLHAHIVVAATPVVASEDNEARASFRQGETDYKLGRFDDALVAFSRAYQLNPIPGFLFNIGQCHFNLKNYERAIFFYEGYLRDLPTAPNRVATRGQIMIAKRELARQQQVPRKASVAPESSSAPVLVKPVVTPASEPFATPAPPPSVEVRTPVYKTWWLWTIVGVVVVGGAAAATAIVLTNKPRAVLPSGSLPTIDERGQ